MIKIKFKRVRENCILPGFKKDGDAGADCCISMFSNISSKKLFPVDRDIFCLQPNDRVACHLGFATEIPEGYYCQVVPRSGLALWEGITIVNSPGTIDSGYRGEWIAIVLNTSKSPVKLKIGERIAQLIVREIVEAEFKLVEELSKSERGTGGLGSTGRD